MTTTRQRLEAIDDIVRTTGKSREAVLHAVGPSWGLGFGELSVLREAMAHTPGPKTPARASEDPRPLADRQHAKALADRAVADVAAFRTWRDLKATNPHAAALLLNRNADQVMRGRTLDTDPQDDGPKAA